MIARRARALLGTLVDIEATGEQASIAIEAAFAVIAEVHRLMSFHEAESDVSRINHSDSLTPISISSKTYEVLQCAQEISVYSHGAFDVTMASKLVDAHFLPRPADSRNIDPDNCYQDIVLQPPNQLVLNKRTWIDLGGIAKGYAVDCAIEVLKNYGINSAMINAGGDLRFFGEPRPIKIRHPKTPGALVNLGTLESCAVATSSGFFSTNSLGDALVDTNTQTCIHWEGSVSIIASTCMIADALTKVIRIQSQRSEQTLTHFNASVVHINAHGTQAFGFCQLNRLLKE